MIQLIKTASSPQQKLDWFLPACQIRWQTRPVREPSSWNKTIIVDPCLKKEKCDDNSDIFNNMAKSPVSLLNVQQTRRGSGSQKSKLLLQRICRHSWKIRIKNKRQKCMSRKLGKLIFCCVLCFTPWHWLLFVCILKGCQNPIFRLWTEVQKYLITAVSLPCSTPSH